MGTDAIDRFRIIHSRAIAAVRVRGHADRWDLGDEALAKTLQASVEAWSRALDAPPATHAVAEYLAQLHAEDLILACACKAGIARAWEHFVEQYRGMLQAAARALLHDDLRARDLADSLYAELYGLEERDGVRRSLLNYFHGRSSLRTWLKAVVAQRFVDTYRAHQRVAAISEAVAHEHLLTTAAPQEDPPEPRSSLYVAALQEAIATTLAELNPRDRMRLNFYYLEDLTLKEIGRITGEYESSVSRRLTRTRRELRRRIEQILRREKKFSDEQIRLCYDRALEAWPADLSRMIKGSLK
jgi:RNA polymerase sigma-70 factor (ECF subfamily)